jgi:uncharacterized protein (TIGR03000 family)
MYSIVMMMALTTGADLTACHRRHDCAGCYCAGGCVCAAPVCGGCHVSHACCGRLFHRRHRCHGCYVCGGYAPVCGCSGAVVYPAPAPAPAPGTTLPPPHKGKATSLAPASGTILVSLPADAQLTVDGQPTTSSSSSRLLVTPNLEPGYEYYYTLRASIVRDGQTLTQEQRVAVHAGEQTRVSFDFSGSSVAANR